MIRIRIKVKSTIRIRITVESWIRIRINVYSWIGNRIKVMRIRIPALGLNINSLQFTHSGDIW